MAPPGFPVGCQASRASAALAAPQHIGADHEVTIGIDRQSRANQPIPPAPDGVARACRSGGMAVTAESMQQQHPVVASGIEPAPALETPGPQTAAKTSWMGFMILAKIVPSSPSPNR